MKVGNLVRMEAALLTCTRPDRFNVSVSGGLCSTGFLAHVADCWLRAGGFAGDGMAGGGPLTAWRKHRGMARRHLVPRGCTKRMCTRDWHALADFTGFQAGISLPGKMNGAYSRHLNILWGIGTPVLVWNSAAQEASIVQAARTKTAASGDGPTASASGSPVRTPATRVVPRGGAAAPDSAPFAENHKTNWTLPMYHEWYYPALTPGRTHIEVSAGTVVGVVDDLLARNEAARRRRAALADAASQVHNRLMCPCCLVEYYSQLFDALADAQGKSEAQLEAMALDRSVVQMSMRKHTLIGFADAVPNDINYRVGKR